MKKNSYEYAKIMCFERPFPVNYPIYFNVIPMSYGQYAIADETYSIFLAKGKELKGYIGDIIYLQYDGEEYATGTYILKSDRHGVICTFRPEREVKNEVHIPWWWEARQEMLGKET